MTSAPPPRFFALSGALALAIVWFTAPGVAAPLDAQTQDLILWSDERPLTWADFRAPAAVGQRMGELDASIDSGFTRIEWQCSAGDELRFSGGRAYFDPNNSWLRAGLDYDRLLAHEQGHFDITELHARKLRLELRAVSCVGRAQQEVGRDAEAALRRIVEQEDAEQTRYDEETGHGMLRHAQQSWQATIRTRLAATRGQ